jgi:nucleotide-binding universal stress UspA family protein
MQDEGQYNILVPVALPSAGPGLVRAAAALAPRHLDPEVCAVHVERIAGANAPARVLEEIEEIRTEALGSASREALVLGLPLRTCSLASEDPVAAIEQTARDESAELIVMGWPRPAPGGRDPGPTVDRLLDGAHCDVAVLLDRREPPWRNVLLPFVGGAHDLLAVDLVRRIADSGASVTILHIVEPGRDGAEPPRLRTRETGSFRDEHVTLRVVESRDAIRETIREARNGYDLIVVGVTPTFAGGLYPWGLRHQRLTRESEASLLVVRSRRDVAARRAVEEAEGEPAAANRA